MPRRAIAILSDVIQSGAMNPRAKACPERRRMGAPDNDGLVRCRHHVQCMDQLLTAACIQIDRIISNEHRWTRLLKNVRALFSMTHARGEPVGVAASHSGHSAYRLRFRRGRSGASRGDLSQVIPSASPLEPVRAADIPPHVSRRTPFQPRAFVTGDCEEIEGPHSLTGNHELTGRCGPSKASPSSVSGRCPSLRPE